MDPLAQAIQLLTEALETISLLAEENATLKQGKGKEEKPDANMQKTASEITIANIFGISPDDLPEFAKYASLEDARTLRQSIETDLSYGTLGKTAEFDDGTATLSPAEQLNARLASIIDR